MMQSISETNGRRTFLRQVVAQAIFSFLNMKGVSASLPKMAYLDLPRNRGLVVGGRDLGSNQHLCDLIEPDLLQAARARLAQLYRNPQTRGIDCPISFLQRTFRLAFGKACALADVLERLGDWSAQSNNHRILYGTTRETQRQTITGNQRSQQA